METPHLIQSEDEVGLWHPAMRPNAHEPDRFHNEESGQKSLGLDAQTPNDNELTLHSPRLLGDVKPQETLDVPNEEQNLPGAPIQPGARLPVSGDDDPTAPQRSTPDLDNEAALEHHSHHDIAKGIVPGVTATGPTPAYHYQDLEAHKRSLRPVLANEEPNPHKASAEDFPVPTILSDTLGDREEMNKAWESEANAAAPGHFDRTNSFPTVPPTRARSIRTENPLSHSQAEEIMKEDVADGLSEHEPPWISLPPRIADVEAAQDPLVSTENQEYGDIFANYDSVRSVATATVDEESRYEEGLPLLPSMSQTEQSSLPQAGTRNAQAAKFAEMDEEEDFFHKGFAANPEDPSIIGTPPLNRKSTSQFLSSIHYQPYSVNHVALEDGEERPSISDPTGGGSAVSAATITSQVSAEDQKNHTAAELEGADLAEMWKAALGDDDLLEVDEPSVDPSSFFEDDGEGFLEEHQNQEEAPLFGSVVSPPPLHPTHTKDGSMQGFDNGDTQQKSTQSLYQPSSNLQAPQVTPSTLYASQNGGRASRQQQQASSGLKQSAYSPIGFASAPGERPFTAQSPSSRPQIPTSTQSFADKSKGGYTSPYDLPMDVTRPKKRTPYQPTRPATDAQTVSSRPPPPRSSSMFPSAPPSIGVQPSVPRLPSAQLEPQMGDRILPPLKPSSNAASFFEELPSKPRHPNVVNRNVPLPSQPIPPLPAFSQRDLPRKPSLTEQLAPEPPRIPHKYDLVPPERMSLFGSVPHAEASIQTLPTVNLRYSPAPTKASSVPPPPNRYAASPFAGSRQSSQALPFQPRTSSPLAQNHAMPQQKQLDSVTEPPFQHRKPSGSQDVFTHGTASDNLPVAIQHSPERPQRASSQAEHQRIRKLPHQPHSRESPSTLNPLFDMPHSDFPATTPCTAYTPEPEHISSDSFPLQQPPERHVDAQQAPMQPIPRRSQTQSPRAGKYLPELPINIQNPYQRPASVNDRTFAPPSQTMSPSVNAARPRGRTLSKQFLYVRPTDGRELDHLERWKGCPIISFGFGGAIVTSFPKQIPRYTAGQTAPLVKCSPGEVKLQDGKILPIDEDLATFPGPLKSKSKKKDVMDWLQKRIWRLEHGANQPISNGLLPDPGKRYEEKILLWKILCVFVEHDGVIDGSTAMEVAVNHIFPELRQGGDAANPPPPFNEPILGIKQRGPCPVADIGKPEAVEELRKKLLRGEREQAVWYAVDNRLWAHAMLLSSTLDRNIWKQVSQEFVRQEVKTLGENTESLAALYQVFAGNWDESMDELVPPSARAGLQMVSKTASTGPIRNALDGLDRWRETMTLILSNRCADDSKALVSLGQLLAGYGRTEAAHTCYLFAKAAGIFGGPDDPQVRVSLLGADHIRDPFDYSRDLDSILLTEVYDFARTVLASSSAATGSPHLQSYKLYHAMVLAEHGYRMEAQQYCEIITSALKSTTKPSPYYHGLLFGALDNLMDRLQQAPRDSLGSWMSKPSIDKVSGSIWAKFNQYVAGDESDAASTGSGKGLDQDLGPFGKVNGDSPSLSREPSSGDLYSSYPMGVGIRSSGPTANPASSRYAPPALHTPRSSLEQTGLSSQEFQHPTQAELLRPSLTHQQYQSRPTSSNGSHYEPYKPVLQPSNYLARTESYLPTPPSQPEYTPVAPPDELSSALYQQDPYQATPPLEPEKSREVDQSAFGAAMINSYEPPAPDYSALSPSYTVPYVGGYDPPVSNGYEPPSFNPDIPPAVESLVDEKPKKKSAVDDDDEDDFEARAAALRKMEKERKDREADEAFRKAAEADAKKDKAPQLNAKKSGWLGGWFGGKKEGDAAQGAPNAPIKAKLGEQSSFYYDPEKKRWIDKKNPDATPAATATPPPPKGGPSRAVSGPPPPRPASTSIPPVPPLSMATSTSPMPSSGPSTSNNISRNPSPVVSPPVIGEATAEAPHASMRSVSGPPSGPPSAPPSRPATGMSGSSSIDDLIGVPQARKGGTVRKGKKGRGYVDVMAK